jgi:hypothetical protein
MVRDRNFTEVGSGINSFGLTVLVKRTVSRDNLNNMLTPSCWRNVSTKFYQLIVIISLKR